VALDLLLGAAIGETQTKFGFSVKTGSYPGGSANDRVKEIVGHRHE
jgi:hypothetical protein